MKGETIIFTGGMVRGLFITDFSWRMKRKMSWLWKRRLSWKNSVDSFDFWFSLIFLRISVLPLNSKGIKSLLLNGWETRNDLNLQCGEFLKLVLREKKLWVNWFFYPHGFTQFQYPPELVRDNKTSEGFKEIFLIVVSFNF